jgi:hypothetical protein
MSTDNLAFTPLPIEAVGLRLGEGTTYQVSTALIQRTTALRAYSAFTDGRDWMDKLSMAYVVALATRSADIYVMRQIQSTIIENPAIPCAKCREATFGVNVIRSRIFPKLSELRVHSNTLIHHLDRPDKKGIAELNIQGVFDYCYHLFQENADLLFGNVPECSFPYTKCKKCKAKGRLLSGAIEYDGR